jgi:hypothetical protein
MALMSEDKVIIGSSKTVDQVIVQKAKNKKYKLCVDEDIAKKGMEFYLNQGAMAWKLSVFSLARKFLLLLFGATL